MSDPTTPEPTPTAPEPGAPDAQAKAAAASAGDPFAPENISFDPPTEAAANAELNVEAAHAAAGAVAEAVAEASAADQAAIDELLKQATFDSPTDNAPAGLPNASQIDLPAFQQVLRDAQVSSIDLLRDVDLSVKIELGRSRMLVEDVLKLGEGSVVELDKLAGDPVDVFVNERLVARGEVLVLNDNFCVRVNEIVAGVREEGL